MLQCVMLYWIFCLWQLRYVIVVCFWGGCEWWEDEFMFEFCLNLFFLVFGDYVDVWNLVVWSDEVMYF